MTGTPTLIAENNGTIIVALDDRSVARIAGGATTTSKLAIAPDLVAVSADGTAYFSDVTGVLWSWRAGSAPGRVELPEPVDALWIFDGRPIAHTPRALTELDIVPFHAVPSDSTICESLGDRVAACISSQAAVSLLDLVTGGRLDLRVHALSREIVATDDEL